MRRTTLAILAASALLFGCNSEPPSSETASAPRSPNFVLIVADDMAYTDLGSYGSEISTPNLDRLAATSVKLTNFHVAPTCAPTRSMLLSGTDNHTAGLGSMFNAGTLSGVEDQPGYELYLHERVATLPELLTDAGYHTYMAGKWHLGTTPDQMPSARGFERSFALVPGSGPHLEALANQYTENGPLNDAPIPDFYSTRTHTDKLIGFIDEHHGDGQPFFVFAAYTSPHWPLQVPDDFLDRYAGRYDDGYDVLKQERVKNAVALGVVPDTGPVSDTPTVGPAWDDLTPEQQRNSARKMEIYAAMVENLDFHVGRLITHLEDIGELDNTYLVFMSDNGAESDDMERNPTFMRRIVNTNADNSYENLGRLNSFVSYGSGWAQAGSAPFSRFKGFINEGGTRVPAFIGHGSGNTPPGIDNQFLRVMDIAPTFLELAGADGPTPLYRGRDVAEMEGRSFAGILEGNQEPVYSDNEPIGAELHGHRSLRLGQYKLIWEQAPGNTYWGYPVPENWYRWRLYDIAADPAETNDLSASMPEKIAEMAKHWEAYAEAHGVVRNVRIVDFERWRTTAAEQ